MIASSILTNYGFKNVVNIHGGFAKIREVGEMEFIAGKCPTQLRMEKMDAIKQ